MVVCWGLSIVSWQLLRAVTAHSMWAGHADVACAFVWVDGCCQGDNMCRAEREVRYSLFCSVLTYGAVQQRLGTQDSLVKKRVDLYLFFAFQTVELLA